MKNLLTLAFLSSLFSSPLALPSQETIPEEGPGGPGYKK